MDGSLLTYVVPATAIVLYLAMVFLLPGVMAKRKAFDLKVPLQLWNLFLCVLSLVMLFGIAPAVFGYSYSYGLVEAICDAREVRWKGPALFWMW
jgi:hypothetical protein